MIRIVLFGDTSGVPQLLKHLPEESVVGIIGACIRPQYLDDLARLADERGIPFLVQPKWNSTEYDDFKAELSKLGADLVWVNSYSMIIRDDVLALARLGGLNIHSALLPRYRGCNPTQWAILNGEVVTGVTLHELTNGIDQGPVVDQKEVPIFLDDTWVDVRDRLSIATESLIQENRERIVTGTWSSVAQVESEATVGVRRKPEDSEFSWDEPVIDIYNKVRALVPPLPPAYFRDSSGQTHTIDRFETLSEITVRKFGHRGNLASRNGVRLVPEITARTDAVRFAIATGTCEIAGIDWNRRCAELQLQRADPDVLAELVEFSFTELKLNRVRLPNGDVVEAKSRSESA